MDTSSPRLPGWAVALLAPVAAIVAGWLGLQLGEAFAYALAEWVDRDLAELKDVLIWCSLMGALVGALAGIWLTLRLARTRRWIQRSALIVTGLAAFGAVAIGLAGYPWPKASGVPVIEYELRLPAGLATPNLSEIDLGIWSGNNGHGCFIRELRMAGGRPEITGSMVLGLDNLTPTVSLALHRKAEGVWRLPYKPDAALEKSFGPWQRIEFIPNPRRSLPPLPAGDYDIRYRLRRYM